MNSSANRSVVILENGTEYVFMQEKGQKKYGPPVGWLGPPPPKGCEVFIGKLPRTVTEEELISIFASVGTIYEFRLMVDFSRSCRGYAFATYTNKEDAEKAVKKFDNYVIRPHRHIGVCKSINNCRLFLRGISNWVTEELMLNEIRQLTDGVVGIKISSNCYDANKKLGVAFVDYENHRAASIARRVLMDDDVTLLGESITVDWADPGLDVSEIENKQVATLFVHNVPFIIDENTLYTLFSEKGQLPIRNIEKKKNCAFICYFYREDAARSLKRLNGFIHEGWLLKVSWAKPQLIDTKGSENSESSIFK